MQLDHKKERIMAVDLLRGYFLFVIIIDHLMRFPGLFDLLTGRGVLWVSAAEGFFFVSGMMVGLVRGHKMLTSSMRQVTTKLLRRSLKLYLWAVGLTILFTLVGFAVATNPHLKGGLTSQRDIWQLIWHTMTFQYAYGWADFLQHYAIYLALSPLAIWLLRKKFWPVVLLLSFIVWLLRGNNIYASWQILFFSGTVVGFYLKSIEQTFQSWSKRAKKICLTLLVILTAVTMTASFLIVLGQEYSIFAPWHQHFKSLLAQTAPYFARSQMHAPRLALFALWFSTSYVLVRKFEAPLMRLLGDFLVPLGQNSLYVYIWQAVIIFFFDLFTPVHQPFWINLSTNIVIVGLIWFMVKRRFLFSIIPR